MTVTLTIKQVPKALAAALKARAAANKRSLQKELLLVMESAVVPNQVPAATSWPIIAEPAHASYTGHSPQARGSERVRESKPGKLNLEQLWERARKLGVGMPNESTDIVRKDRDAHRY